MKKVGIILLAAGNSKRYGGLKLLDLVGHKKMYMHILDIALLIEASPKIVVTQYDEIEESALAYGFHVVRNNEPDIGISHSIQLGLKKALEIESNLDGVLFSVCDQPYLKQETMEKLLAAYSNSEKSMATISFQGILGNPCIIGKAYFNDLFALTGDKGGKGIISRFKEDVELIAIEDEKEMKDIDRRK